VNKDDQLRFIYLEYLQRNGRPNGNFTYKPETYQDILPEEILIFYWIRTGDEPTATFATLGMSSIVMDDGEKAEMQLTVRGVFDPDEIMAFTRFLANTSLYPFLHNFAVDWWQVIVDVGRIPVYPDASTLLVHPEPSDDNYGHIFIGDDFVKLLNLVPLTSLESSMVQDKGVVSFLDYLEENKIDMQQIR
jgi:hypothetical protein